ncbi:MAG: hydroxyacid dehydrogenase, partial [Bacteroidia bacterium]|nr:hydroxyacid dehydrogenase [Bacteroidia bacterium]
MKKKVLFIDSVHPRCKELLEENGFECFLHYDKSEDEIIKEIENYEAIIIRSKFIITKEIIDRAKNLKCIGRAGAGMENIDVEYAEKKGIKCLHAPEGNKDAVAEHAMGMLLSLFNNLNRANAEVRKGIWEREKNRGIELKGKTVGIIGYGNMGSAFAERLKGFGVKILAYDKYKKSFGNEFVAECRIEELYENADVVSLHIPLTKETNYLVNTSWINNFKKNIFIINTARGKCLNTEDLVKSIVSGKVSGACLDVLEYESVSFEKMESEKFPEPFQFLIKSEKVIVSPH